MTKEEKYDQALSEYLEHGINYNATPIKNTPADDLKALASDSFHYGYLHGCNRIADLTAENTRLREALEGFIKIRQLIEYKEPIKEKHYGEAQAIWNAIEKAEQALNPDNSK